MREEVLFRFLKPDDCKPTLLDGFHRAQRVSESWRNVDGEWILVKTPFEEDWDQQKKQDVIADFKDCIETGGQVIGCFREGMLIGWACVKRELFGSTGQYANLAYLHVSLECRNMGLGKELFARAQRIAREIGAKKLYISGHSSKETQAFYKSVGCCEAIEIDPDLFRKEPFDCHLEYIL